MATKTLTRSGEAVARPVEPEIAKSGYTGGWWAVRGKNIQLNLDAEEDLEAAAAKIVAAGFQADIDREIGKIAALPPFASLRSLRERIAESELTIHSAREQIVELKTSLGPDASAADVARVRKQLDHCDSRIAEASLQRDNAQRFTADAFAECERLARESLPAIVELFRDRAANFTTHLGDQFWAVARDFFLNMSVSEMQAALVSGYLQQVMSRVDLILDPAGWEAEMFRLSCATRGSPCPSVRPCETNRPSTVIAFRLRGRRTPFAAPASPLRPAAKHTAVPALGGACGGVAVRFDGRTGRVGTAVSEVARMW